MDTPLLWVRLGEWHAGYTGSVQLLCGQGYIQSPGLQHVAAHERPNTHEAVCGSCRDVALMLMDDWLARGVSFGNDLAPGEPRYLTTMLTLRLLRFLEHSSEASGFLAAGFSLPTHDGGVFTLPERGRVVLAFLPFAFTGTCSQEVPALSQLRVQRPDLPVVGVTCDAVPSLKQWSQAMPVSGAFPLCSDFWPHGVVSRAYGVFNEEVGRPDRAVFVVDDGFVVYSDVYRIAPEPRKC